MRLYVNQAPTHLKCEHERLTGISALSHGISVEILQSKNEQQLDGVGLDICDHHMRHLGSAVCAGMV